MHFAVIPIVVWGIVAALTGLCVGGGGVAIYWSTKDYEKVKESHRNNAGVVDVIADPQWFVCIYIITRYLIVIIGNINSAS